jgi:hypothetical protein
VDETTPLLADAVIVATGASAKYLGLENEARLLGRGVSACATCDGAFFRNQEVAIVGGGDTALEEALFLTRFATRVHLIHRRDSLRASQIMQARAFANEKIQFHWNTTVTDVLGETPWRGCAEGRRDQRGADAPGGRVLRRHRPPAEHRPLQGLARHGRDRLHPRRSRTRRGPTSRACSRAATRRTTSTARP